MTPLPCDPNPAILAMSGYTVVKVQPPDGMVIELADGSRYCVTAHRCGP